MSGGFFISYRRGDNRYAARSIYEALVKRFPGEIIFMDVTGIEPGLDFERIINERVGSCDAMLVVIGREWMNDPRLNDHSDFVRLEIEAALNRDVRVIPILIDGIEVIPESTLPPTLKPLAKRQAVRLSHATFDSDLQPLITTLQKILSARPQPQRGAVRTEGKKATDAVADTEMSAAAAEPLRPAKGKGAVNKIITVATSLGVAVALSYLLTSLLVFGFGMERGETALTFWLSTSVVLFVLFVIIAWRRIGSRERHS